MIGGNLLDNFSTDARGFINGVVDEVKSDVSRSWNQAVTNVRTDAANAVNQVGAAMATKAADAIAPPGQKPISIPLSANQFTAVVIGLVIALGVILYLVFRRR